MKFIVTICIVFLFSCGEEPCPSGVMDCAGICDGILVADCAGECAGTKVVDACDTCDDDSDNDELQGDCTACGNGEPDCAGNCDIAETAENEANASIDCKGICEGTAQLNSCGICDGNVIENCDDLCNGEAYDCNGCCESNTNAFDATNCSYLGNNSTDCLGICGGSATEDCAGTCNGSASQDCMGICEGFALVNSAGECIECSSGVFDCAGICDGTDIFDCEGVCGGTVLFDVCGVCGGIEINPSNCDVEAMVLSANQMLFKDLRNIFQDVEDENIVIDDNLYDELNMSTAKGLYEAILELEPGNYDANFGLAFIELTDISQDNNFRNLIEQWRICLQDLDLEVNQDSDTQSEMSSFLMNNNLSTGIPFSASSYYSLDVLDILQFIPIVTSHNEAMLLQRFGEDDVCPEIESVQDMLENLFLERLALAISRLENVVDNDFIFEITGEMWDDVDQDPIHIDDTEIYLMKGLLHSLRAIIYTVITYDVNIPFYDFIEDLPSTDYTYNFLNQNSNFLTIRSGQSQSLPNAHDDLNNILISLQKSWDFLQSDYAIGGDNIEYDIIQLAEVVELEEEIHEEYNEIHTIDGFINEVDSILNEDYLTTVYIETNCVWDHYGWQEIEVCDENEVEITISIKDFFTNPPSNLKNIIPNYNIETVTCEDEEWDNDNNNHSYNITIQDLSIENSLYYYFNGYCHESDGSNNVNVYLHTYNDYYLKNIVEEEMQIICQEIVSNYDGEVNSFYMNFNLSGYGNSGELTISSESYYEIETYESIAWGCPQVTFTSYSCGAWKEEFDVTIGGLFPNMTTTKFFDEIIQLSEGDCEEILGGNTP